MIFHLENSLDDSDSTTVSKPLSNDKLLLTRGSLFGDGFFTTGIIENGKILHKSHHFERLKQSAERLKYDLCSLEEIQKNVNKSIKEIKKAAFRLTLTRSQEQRGYALSKQYEVIVYLQISPYSGPPQEPCELKFASTPISTNSLLAGIKHLNRLDSVLAASEVKAPNQEVLLCNRDLVICGSRTNLFVKHNGVWKTAPITDCGIEGITRKRILDYFKDKKIEYAVQPINKQQLDKVTSAFVTNSLVGIWPVSIILGREICENESKAIKLEFECLN